MMKCQRRAGMVAAVLCAGLPWACKAPPVPDPGESALWNSVHGVEPAGASKVEPAQAAQEEPWEGEVVFSEKEIDLGDVKRGDQAKHSFTITNKTNRVLDIKNVRGS